jgi:glutaminyl-peptide cyclotransferase
MRFAVPLLLAPGRDGGISLRPMTPVCPRVSWLLPTLELALLATAATSGCVRSEATRPAPSAPARAVEELAVRVVRALPHDRGAFTQGLLFFEGRLYESTGLLGRSSVRRVDPESGQIEAQVALDPQLFGEGLARVGGHLVQLTWQNGRAIYWNLAALTQERQVDYQGEGWGLCFDGKRLVMSDGSEHLVFRDPDTFARQGEVSVRRAGVPVRSLNELECDAGIVYANIWQDSHIARIDPQSGEVTGWIDASGLLASEDSQGADVLNGIASVPGTRHLLLTGKLWPRAFEVELVPAPGQ